MNDVSRQFNLARYCLADTDHRPPEKAGLLVFDSLDRPPQIWTYGTLREQVCCIAGGLAETGLQRGDRILLRMGNCAEYALSYFAAIAAGFVPIPASSLLTADEVEFILADSEAGAIVASPELDLPPLAGSVMRLSSDDIMKMAKSAKAIDFANTAADDPAYLVYTSGTTSRPKGVLHAHRAAWGRRPMHAGWYGLSTDDVMLHAGAFNWTYTIGTGLTDPWSLGATAVVYTGEKAPAIWPALIRQSGATMFATVPTLFRQILKYAPAGPMDLGRLRHGLSAGESLPTDVATEWKERTGTTLYEAFGMSEISTYISTPAGSVPAPGSPGHPQTGRRIAILPAETLDEQPLPPGETGVIAVHTSDPGFMLRYWNRPDEQAQMMRGDWFITGDLAFEDEAGFFFLAGRMDDVMNARGFRVSPVEVETVLATHSGVSEVAVTACEVAPNVQAIVAFVVWRDDPHDGELLTHARAHLAGYKVPGEIVSLSALPRGANGKIMRRSLPALRTARNSG